MWALGAGCVVELNSAVASHHFAHFDPVAYPDPGADVTAAGAAVTALIKDFGLFTRLPGVIGLDANGNGACAQGLSSRRGRRWRASRASKHRRRADGSPPARRRRHKGRRRRRGRQLAFPTRRAARSLSTTSTASSSSAPAAGLRCVRAPGLPAAAGRPRRPGRRDGGERLDLPTSAAAATAAPSRSPTSPSTSHVSGRPTGRRVPAVAPPPSRRRCRTRRRARRRRRSAGGAIRMEVYGRQILLDGEVWIARHLLLAVAVWLRPRLRQPGATTSPPSTCRSSSATSS